VLHWQRETVDAPQSEGLIETAYEAETPPTQVTKKRDVGEEIIYRKVVSRDRRNGELWRDPRALTTGAGHTTLAEGQALEPKVAQQQTVLVRTT
jgi:hypothetical protein